MPYLAAQNAGPTPQNAKKLTTQVHTVAPRPPLRQFAGFCSIRSPELVDRDVRAILGVFSSVQRDLHGVHAIFPQVGPAKDAVHGRVIRCCDWTVPVDLAAIVGAPHEA
eukprot:1106001-Prymnesium_polylepis.1